ncbi:unnamed protein product, partial [Didymodactylos carnosus]
MGKDTKRKSQLKNLRIKKRTSSSYSEKQTDSSSEEEGDLMFQLPGDTDFTSKEVLDTLNELMSLCKQNSNTKCLSVLLYMSLRHFSVSYRDADKFLDAIGAFKAETCHTHSDRLLHYGVDRFATDLRGGKRGDSFWDSFPDIEHDARQFSIEACTRKNASFTVEELAKFVDEKFFEVTGLTKDDPGFIRSTQSLRLDLKAWGITYTNNRSRPYFLGQEKPEVVLHREQVINYFLSREQFYFHVSDGNDPKWLIPTVPEP